MVGILCDDIMSERSKMRKSLPYLILAGWHLSERDIILDFVLALVVLAMTLHSLPRAAH